MSKLGNKWKNFRERFLKPFFFSSNCNKIKVSYFYAFILMSLLFILIIQFIILAYEKYDSGILASLAGVIATISGLYFGNMKIYNEGTAIKNNQSASQFIPYNKSESITEATVINTSSNIETEVD